MDYMTAREAADKWGISQRRVAVLCSENRIENAARLEICGLSLKSNKCDRNGKPLETVFITQIASVIDELLEERPFQETHLYEKISNMLYVPVCKGGIQEIGCF